MKKKKKFKGREREGEITFFVWKNMQRIRESGKFIVKGWEYNE